MSEAESQPVSIKLLEKEFNFNCPPDAEAELLASADFLNTKMLEIRKSGKVLGLERIAIMAALNLAHELLQSKQEIHVGVADRLQHLGDKIDQALTKQDKAASLDTSE
ncbi:cell division protein ZapA [uncultured Neptuniibacter sp.]|uniref:cell division protein ZapA n=1 Tax=uncultured Neptuniibacter sp. TaxID=502143 RepID=UPI002611D157|nr:cell division protein ZapA [uncultured Neptuniibacter sp.]